jgi:hypothetical protein
MANQQQPIGEEMMKWAEKYWLIDMALKKELDKHSEAFSYDQFRSAFIAKMELEIKNRLFPIQDPELYSISA